MKRPLTDASLQFRGKNEGRYGLDKRRNGSYRKALLGHVRSIPADDVHVSDCSHCAAKNGPFEDCRVVTDGDKGFLLNGSCTNCAFGGHGNRCQFYTGAPAKKRSTSTSYAFTFIDLTHACF